ncbi:TPA: stress response membrane protein YncL, partial [Escherichia albertii]|nr:stress response membrane protein YncL [Escherichia albertii]
MNVSSKTVVLINVFAAV